MKALAMIGAAVIILPIAIGIGLLFGFPIMWLWNYTMPVIFHLPTIDFWHAVALSTLIHWLFPSSTSSSN